MAPSRSRTRISDNTTPTSTTSRQLIPTKASSPVMHRSPMKRVKMGPSLAQKQALIDNLQLEITERARRLRAQYNLQAQGLRSRVEIRVNRIPMSLRALTMGELLLKCAEQSKRQKLASTTRPPPVPAKDGQLRHSPLKPSQSTVPLMNGGARGYKRSSGELGGADKENEVSLIENPKKRPRGAPTANVAASEAAQVLSPTSTNSRVIPIGRAHPPPSPTKSYIARPTSPTKMPAYSRTPAPARILSNLVEKAKSTRAAAATRKETTVSNTSSSSGAASTGAAARTRRTPAAAATRTTVSRNARRLSGVSDSSDGSTSTVVKKTTARSAPAASRKATAGTAGTKRAAATASTVKKAAAAKKSTAAAATTTTTRASTRVLRKRG